MEALEGAEQNRRSAPHLSDEEKEFVYGKRASSTSTDQQSGESNIWKNRVIDGLILIGLVYALLNQ